MTRKCRVLVLAVCLIATASAVPWGASAAVKYSKVASFKDVGQSRVFFISIDEKVPADQLEPELWEIVNYHMDTYGQAPQMWIYFFDSKKLAPKDFPIQGDFLDHLIATYFYATDNRTKQLKILNGEDVKQLKSKGKIDSPLWQGQ
jgi:hypothetical protein